MANRSYLYACDFVPSEEREGKCLQGISEYNYDIPLAFKILLSGNPQTCVSSIWEMPEHIAIYGDYAQGVANLNRFFEKIAHLPEAPELIEKSQAFLSDTKNQGKYFVLECGEIFDMGIEEGSLEEQNSRLLDEIIHVEQEIERFIDAATPPKQSLLSRLFGKRNDDEVETVHTLGISNWSNVLYFDLRCR